MLSTRATQKWVAYLISKTNQTVHRIQKGVEMDLTLKDKTHVGGAPRGARRPPAGVSCNLMYRTKIG